MGYGQGRDRRESEGMERWREEALIGLGRFAEEYF